MCVLRGMFLIEIQGFTFHYRGSSNPKLSLVAWGQAVTCIRINNF
jgi:hypothetical protein